MVIQTEINFNTQSTVHTKLQRIRNVNVMSQPLALGHSRNCGRESWKAVATRGQEKAEEVRLA